MLIAVTIPFRGNPDTLQWVLEGYAQQQLPPDTTLEVRLCGDGVPVPPTPPSTTTIRFASLNSPRVGVGQARNLLLIDHPADLVIATNSDTRPSPSCVAAHASRLLALPPHHMVLGAAPYEPSATPSVFDLLIEESPMIFFYQGLKPHSFCDFRHCWTLNLSIRYADLQQLHFFNPVFRPWGHEDLDLGFRLAQSSGIPKPIFFEPAAQVLHRHPMTFDDYLNREELLGVMAPVLHAANPAAFQALYQTTDLNHLAAQFRTWIELDRPSHAWVYKRLQEWNSLPASTLGTGPARERLLLTLYQMHIPLKRLAFRLGFLRGLTLQPDSCWLQRTPQSLWRQHIFPQ